MISIIGCLIGVGLVWVERMVAEKFLPIKTLVTQNSILISFIVATGVGVFFGFYPAYKASKLEPIEALRYQ